MDSTIAVASLKRLSPSTSTVSRFGAPSWRKREMTPTGSVALKIVPRRKASGHSIPTRTCMATATSPVLIRSPGTARVRTGVRLSRRSRASMLKADSKTRAGRKTKKTASGGSLRATRGCRSSGASPASCETPMPTTTRATA